MSIDILIIDSKRKTDYFIKTPDFKPTSQISNYTTQQQNFLTMLNFQHSQITQQEFEQLAELLLKYPMVYAISEFDVEKINSLLHLLLKPDAVFKKNEQVKFQFTYKINSIDY